MQAYRATPSMHALHLNASPSRAQNTHLLPPVQPLPGYSGPGSCCHRIRVSDTPCTDVVATQGLAACAIPCPDNIGPGCVSRHILFPSPPPSTSHALKPSYALAPDGTPRYWPKPFGLRMTATRLPRRSASRCSAATNQASAAACMKAATAGVVRSLVYCQMRP